jgi:hypothetical protein
MLLDLCPISGRLSPRVRDRTYPRLFFQQTYPVDVFQYLPQNISELFRFDIDIEGWVFRIPI